MSLTQKQFDILFNEQTQMCQWVYDAASKCPYTFNASNVLTELQDAGIACYHQKVSGCLGTLDRVGLLTLVRKGVWSRVPVVKEDKGWSAEAAEIFKAEPTPSPWPEPIAPVAVAAPVTLTLVQPEPAPEPAPAPVGEKTIEELSLLVAMLNKELAEAVAALLAKAQDEASVKGRELFNVLKVAGFVA